MYAKELLDRIRAAEGSRALDLSNFRLEESIPSQIFQLTGLQSLNLYRAQLNALPPELFGLTALIELNCYRNRLTEVPPEISRLTNLRILNLGSNALQTLPDELFSLSLLEELDLSNNRLETISPKISQLTNLRDLKLFRNKLHSLPKELGELSNLKKLDLNHNVLHTLPPRFGLLSAIVLLDLNDNPLRSPPMSVCSRGTAAVLRYLRQQLDQEISAAHSFAEGPGLHGGVAGNELRFVVHAVTAKGEHALPSTPDVPFQVAIKSTEASANAVPAVRVYAVQSDSADGCGLYEVVWSANAAGSYQVDITCDGRPISGSPYTATVEPAGPYPPLCSAVGLGATGPLVIGAAALFTVETTDRYGNQRMASSPEEDAQCPLAVTVTMPGGAAMAADSISVTNNGNGTYDVSYTPTVGGEYTIAVTLGSTAISGSPFRVVAWAPGTPVTAPADRDTTAVPVSTGSSSATAMAAMQTELEELRQKLEREMKARTKHAKSKHKRKRQLQELKQLLEAERAARERAEDAANEASRRADELAARVARLEEDLRVTEEIRSWRRALETELEETRRRLAAEEGTAASLEGALQKVRAELDAEARARADLERLKLEMEQEAESLKSKLIELESMRQRVRQEEAVAKATQEQLLATMSTADGSAAELADLKRDLDGLANSQKRIAEESQRLQEQLGEVEESRRLLAIEASAAPTLEEWKQKFEAELRETMRAEMRARDEQNKVLEETNRRLESELTELKKELAQTREKSENRPRNFKLDIKKAPMGSTTPPNVAPTPRQQSLRERKVTVDPTKLSFREKLQFWQATHTGQ